MIFKDDKSRYELSRAPKKLQAVVQRFSELSEVLGVEPVCTRVVGKIAGDSGVHAARRAADFRDQTFDADGAEHRLYSDEHVVEILSTLNAEFPRNDGKLVAIHHSFQGMPFHFHLQIPFSWLEKGELLPT